MGGGRGWCCSQRTETKSCLDGLTIFWLPDLIEQGCMHWCYGRDLDDIFQCFSALSCTCTKESKIHSSTERITSCTCSPRIKTSCWQQTCESLSVYSFLMLQNPKIVTISEFRSPVKLRKTCAQHSIFNNRRNHLKIRRT